MAYTTCFFWVKFFAFWGAMGLLQSIFNFFWPDAIGSNMILAGFICSPILFSNQIYKAVKKTQATSVNVSQTINKQWLHDNIAVFTAIYKNQFVAVNNQEIIDADANLAMLRSRIQQQGLNLKNVYIEFIKTKELADEYEKLK